MSNIKNIKMPIFAIDFEGSKNIGIVEYGIAEISNGSISQCSTRICAPRSKISAQDSALFDITNETAEHCPPFEDDLSLFCDMRKRGIFAAHNAVAEDTMLRASLPVAPIVYNPLTNTNCASWAPYIDTCTLAKCLFKLDSAKLADVVNVLGLTDELYAHAEKFCPVNRRKWHCALFDAIASALILIKICSFDGFENVSAQWLLKYSNPSLNSQESLL